MGLLEQVLFTVHNFLIKFSVRAQGSKTQVIGPPHVQSLASATWVSAFLSSNGCSLIIKFSYSLLLLKRVSPKIYLSVTEYKLKTASLIFKILTFLNQDFSGLNFRILLFIFA